MLRGIAFVVAALIPLYYANVHFKWLPSLPAPAPVTDGLLALAFVYAFFVGATGRLGIWNAVRGQDGRASTSKFQVFLWTGVVLFAYVAIMGLRWRTGATQPLPDIPGNVLAALGISIGTAAAAAAVTQSQVNRNEVDKSGVTTNLGLAPIFENDEHQIDLAKVQLIAWTFIALAVFLALVLGVLASGKVDASLPDIDPALMVLTGLGSAAYLGNKLVPTTAPTIMSISKSQISQAGTDQDRTVTIKGKNFGADPDRIKIDQAALESPVISWSNTEITFTVPQARPGGIGAWRLGVPLEVVVSTAGADSNAMHVTITQ